MKTLLLILSLMPISCISQSQYLSEDDFFGGYFMTDSVSWYIADIIFIGDTLCKHDWSIKKRPTTNSIPTVYYASGYVPLWRIRKKDYICRKCLRWELWADRYYQYFVSTKNAEFDSLKNKVEEIINENE